MKKFRLSLAFFIPFLLVLESFAEPVPVFPLDSYYLDNDEIQIRAYGGGETSQPPDSAFLCSEQLCLFFDKFLRVENNIKLYESYSMIRLDSKKGVQSIEALNGQSLTEVDRERIAGIYNESAPPANDPGSASGSPLGNGMGPTDLSSAHNAGASSAVAAGVFSVAREAFGPSDEQTSVLKIVHAALKKEIDQGLRISQRRAQKISEVYHAIDESGQRARKILTKMNGHQKRFFVPVDLRGVNADLKEELVSLQKGIQTLPLGENYDQLATHVRTSVELSAESSRQNDDEMARLYADIGTQILDFGLSMTPGIGTGKDIYEFIEGRNFLTGEQLNDWERTAALIGAATFGISKWGTKPVSLLVKWAKNQKLIGKTMGALGAVAKKAGRMADKGFSLLREKAGRLISIAEKKGVEDLSGIKALANIEAESALKASGKAVSAAEEAVSDVGSATVKALDSASQTQWTPKLVEEITKEVGPQGAKFVRGIPGLKFTGQGTWVSEAGLVYGKGSIHNNRLRHILKHAIPDSTKKIHSVFNMDVKEIPSVIDEAWRIKDTGVTGIDNFGRKFYMIKMPNNKVIGNSGEKAIRIIIEKGTSNEIVSAYPWRMK